MHKKAIYLTQYIYTCVCENPYYNTYLFFTSRFLDLPSKIHGGEKVRFVGFFREREGRELNFSRFHC